MGIDFLYCCSISISVISNSYYLFPSASFEFSFFFLFLVQEHLEKYNLYQVAMSSSYKIESYNI